MRRRRRAARTGGAAGAHSRTGPALPDRRSPHRFGWIHPPPHPTAGVLITGRAAEAAQAVPAACIELMSLSEPLRRGESVDSPPVDGEIADCDPAADPDGPVPAGAAMEVERSRGTRTLGRGCNRRRTTPTRRRRRPDPDRRGRRLSGRRTGHPAQSRQNSLPSRSCITMHDSLSSSAGSSRTRTAPSATSRAHSASSVARRSSPTSPVPARTSRCSRFLTALPSGTR